MVNKPSALNMTVIKSAIFESFIKLSPRHQIKNPVMFTVFIASIITTIQLVQVTNGKNTEPFTFVLSITLWLWFTLLFANFAEAIAEGRGKAQAQSLRQSRREISAKKLATESRNSELTLIKSSELNINDIVLVETGDFIPSDGEVIEGIASVDESAVTGESAPVIRESGGDRSAVTGGTKVISDWLIVRITSNPGNTFLDKMIGLVEGADRQKTPNEIALTILLVALTIIFILVCTTLLPFSMYSVQATGAGTVISTTVLVALFVCLAPTTIGGLLSAIGIAGMDRMIQANVIALSGHAVEAAGDVDILILDKTGTITLGNRQATEFITAEGVTLRELAEVAQLSSLADETPEGRSIVLLAEEKYGLPSREINKNDMKFMPFTAEARMSGVDLLGRQIRKGASDVMIEYIKNMGGIFPENLHKKVDLISKRGATALIVADGKMALGIINLKDIVKHGINQRFVQLRYMGIKTIMVTGDNALTAAAIAAEAGVDDFVANVRPEEKLQLIKKYQGAGHLVAMAGDGTNDAPALAQADVALAMNTGTQAAREAGNLIDLDSNPTKLIEVVGIGKQLLMTRGAITTFSIANDIAKYFAILPAAFAETYPELNIFNIMHLASPHSAVLSAVIFNALIIIFLIPLALRGIRYRRATAAQLLSKNAIVYGLGGVIVPFIGIKFIDLILVGSGLTVII